MEFIINEERSRMEVKIIEGPNTDEAIKNVYRYILSIYKKELQQTLDKQEEN